VNQVVCVGTDSGKAWSSNSPYWVNSHKPPFWVATDISKPWLWS
jgi:hypothetical protein